MIISVQENLRYQLLDPLAIGKVFCNLTKMVASDATDDHLHKRIAASR